MCTTLPHKQTTHLFTHSVDVIQMSLTINMYHFSEQCLPVGLSNGEKLCFLYGRHCSVYVTDINVALQKLVRCHEALRISRFTQQRSDYACQTSRNQGFEPPRSLFKREDSESVLMSNANGPILRSKENSRSTPSTDVNFLKLKSFCVYLQLGKVNTWHFASLATGITNIYLGIRLKI